MDDNNVIEFGKAKEERTVETPVTPDPDYKNYMFIDADDQPHYVTGYLAITPAFVAVGVEGGHMIFAMPLEQLKVVRELADESDTE